MRWLYKSGILVYRFFIFFASFFNPKARLWVSGRRQQVSYINSFERSRGRRYWIHCASLGEFEQGRPVMEGLKEKDPSIEIYLSFFSPSGYEIRKAYPIADKVFYLPADTAANAEWIVDKVDPQHVIFVKYEFWFNLIHELYRRNIPYYFVSAIFRENQHFFKWYGSWAAKHLQRSAHVFVQDQNSRQLLSRILSDKKVTVVGDTRVDRVIKISSSKVDLMTSGSQSGDIMVCGSTWPEDEEILYKFLLSENSIRLVIAPHEVTQSRLSELSEKFRQFHPVRYSDIVNNINYRVIIIDSIGLLSSLYRIGKIGYIGGGFGRGIHNILEACVYGIPVIFGPNYKKFREAVELVSTCGAFSIQDENELNQVIEKLKSREFYISSSSATQAYIINNSGASAKVINHLLYT